MTTAEVLAALSAKYAKPAWAFFPEVRNGTGYLRTTRTADALAMSLWPSRGLELHGFEVKTDRGDWLRELREPAKAEEMVAFVDRWWIAVGDKAIVRPGELPPTWGLLVPRGTGLVVDVEAPKLDAQPMGRPFIAALLRKVTETWTPSADIKAAADAAREEGRRDGQAEIEGVRESLADLRKGVSDFERDSGVNVTDWRYGHIGRAVYLVIAKGPEHIRRMVEQHKAWAERVVADCEALLNEAAPPARGQ